MTADDLACRELVELITDYLEGALPAGERARFEAHLAGCRGCRTYLAQMRQTVRTLRQLGDDGLPPQAKDDLLRLFRGWTRR